MSNGPLDLTAHSVCAQALWEPARHSLETRLCVLGAWKVLAEADVLATIGCSAQWTLAEQLWDDKVGNA